jgi:uncharacterized protein
MPLTSLPARAGVFITENGSLSTSTVVTLFSRVYYFGSSTLGDGLTNVPTAIGSLDEFATLFGSSIAINLNNIDCYLKNTTRGLYFCKVKPAPVASITIPTATAGVYDVTIGGVNQTVTIAASPTPTQQSIVTALINAINNNTSLNQIVEAENVLDNSGNPVYTNGEIRIRSKNGATFTLTKNGTNLNVTTVTIPATLNYWDYLSAIDAVAQTEVESPLGFISCPEAFYTLVNQSERTIVGNRLENIARRMRWFAVLDAGSPTIVDHPIKAKADALAYTAPQGHSAYYYPYGVDLDGDDISPSVILTTHALRSYEVYGIDKPPAGASDLATEGISKLRYTLSDSQKNDLAQAKINIIIFKSGVGFLPYDTLTRAVDKKYKMISSRIVLNCVERSVYESIDISGIAFQSNRSKGILYIKLRAVIENVLAAFYDAGALYGATPELAYAVQCDESLQSNAALEEGIVRAAVYLSTAGTARQVETVVYPINIGGLQTALTLA